MQEYKRNCPVCNKELIYKRKHDFKRAETSSSLCKLCSNMKSLSLIDKTKKFLLSSEQQQELCDMYSNGTKTKELSEKFNIDQLTVTRYLHRNNIALRNHSDENRKYTEEERKTKYKEITKKWRETNKEYVRECKRLKQETDHGYSLGRSSKLMNNYGITEEEYQELLKSQNYLCPICNQKLEDTKPRPHVDHCHTTGKVRGILHNRCNVLLGMSQDDPKRLRNAARYLERYKT